MEPSVRSRLGNSSNHATTVFASLAATPARISVHVSLIHCGLSRMANGNDARKGPAVASSRKHVSVKAHS
jgi:hypothetical protein